MSDASPARDGSNAAPKTIRLEDYTPPAFRVEALDLEFDLYPDATIVRARMDVVRDRAGDPLVLAGEGMELLSLSVDGAALHEGDYEVTATALRLDGIGDRARIETAVRLDPSSNTALEGLYMSRGRFYTQCEPEGFRRITYFLDRPDVMTRYRVRITADPAQYPVLLSNGNRVDAGVRDDGRHWSLWEDPFPKPSYLFALFAGDLACLEDSFRTRSGRTVKLYIYAEARDLDKCGHAMESLKAAMRWDEEVYGLEYDLDIYNIVAVGDFNMGAMENKSLNIFNTKCVLAKADTATDADFGAVEAVIAHEYFHNWTGNRVTCRDWFQLSLKEGLTVFRDKQFSADMGSPAVERISGVQMLRAHQFPEDAGPLAHPVRPDSYIEINNFYTATVYEKGSEVIRMMHRILGPRSFRKGMDLYFERHDGQAVTCDDFVSAMADASGVDLGQFKRWYNQAGTPAIKVTRAFHAQTGEYRLTIRQDTPPTPGQANKDPLHIPVAIGLLDRQGRALDFAVEGNDASPADDSGTVTLNVREREQTFTIKGLDREPVPSILRGFSAPVWLDAGLSRDELRFLMAHDTDPFNKWEAGQTLATAILLDMVDAIRSGRDKEVDRDTINAYGTLMDEEGGDKALLAKALTLPGESLLVQRMDAADPAAIHRARDHFRATLGKDLRQRFETLYHENRSSEPYRFEGDEVARRSLSNVALSYLMVGEDDGATALCMDQLATADNMTDEFAALMALAHSARPERHDALARFYDKWQDEDLVVDRWFSVQATAPGPDTLDRMAALMDHPAFTLRNPNRVRALIGAFSQQNPACFHDATGRGYRFLADRVVDLNAINPQVAARLLTPLGRWQRIEPARQALMKNALERVLATDNLSPDVYEVASKSLAQ